MSLMFSLGLTPLDVMFANDAVLLNSSLAGIKGTELHLVRPFACIAVLNYNCLTTNSCSVTLSSTNE